MREGEREVCVLFWLHSLHILINLAIFVRIKAQQLQSPFSENRRDVPAYQAFPREIKGLDEWRKFDSLGAGWFSKELADYESFWYSSILLRNTKCCNLLTGSLHRLVIGTWFYFQNRTWIVHWKLLRLIRIHYFLFRLFITAPLWKWKVIIRETYQMLFHHIRVFKQGCMLAPLLFNNNIYAMVGL